MSKMMKIKAVILDCDGVILDSNQAYEKLYEVLFKHHGIRLTPKQIYAHFGESPQHFLRVFFSPKMFPFIFREYKKQLNDRKLHRMIKIHPGARNAIIGMSREYTLVVVSGALRSRLVNSLKMYKVLKYFSFVLGSDDVKRAKPHPEALLKAIKRMKIKKNEALFVGDAPNDLRAAKAADVRFAAVLSGVFTRTAAKKMRADYIVKDLTEIPKLVKRLNT